MRRRNLLNPLKLKCTALVSAISESCLILSGFKSCQYVSSVGSELENLVCICIIVMCIEV